MIKKIKNKKRLPKKNKIQKPKKIKNSHFTSCSCWCMVV